MNINLSNTDFDFLDPALAYDCSVAVTLSGQLKLLNYPDKPAAAGSQLHPEAARASRWSRTTARPTRSRQDSGLQVQHRRGRDAAELRARSTATANPKMQSPAVAFMHDIVGADDVQRRQGQSAVAGVVGKGRQLTITLTQADSDFLAEVTMPFFAAIEATCRSTRRA